MIAPNTFYIKNNFGIVKIPTGYRARIFSSFVNSYPVTINDNINFNVELIKRPDQVDVSGISLIQYVKKNGFHFDKLLEESFIDNYYNTIMRKDKFLQLLTHFNYSIENTRYIDDKNFGDNLYYKLNYNLSDIEKIDSFQIIKIPFAEMILKRDLYRTN
jgi:hypothetical protein